MLPRDLHANAKGRAAPGGRTSPVVLVVEDEFLVRIVAAESLEAEGFSVVTATTAHEALDCLADGDDIAAVFTDVEMPGTLNGLGLARIVHARWPWIRIVVTSGRAHVAVGEMPPGACFLPKPYRSSTLVEAFRGAEMERLPARQ